MEKAHVGHEETSQARNGSECRPSPRKISAEDGWQCTISPIGMVAIVCAAVLLSGCEGRPVVPLGFGPPLDNLFGLLILLAVVAALYKILVPRVAARRKGITPGTAELIACERYARGEITQDQYTEVLRTLAAG